jgi:hypothetical protein
MTDKTLLTEQFNQARTELRELLPNIDLKMEIYPGWTIKEVIAHLAGWDDATILALDAFVAHLPPPTPAIKGLDSYNEQTVEERVDLGYEQIVREWELIREQLIKVFGNLPDEMLATSIVSPWGLTMTVEQLLKIMINHEKEHADAIRTRLANPQEPPDAH